MKSIYNKTPGYTFSDINSFRKWYTSWYPRLDQLHDSVGVVKNAKEIVYIVEDIFFAKRIASYTGLNSNDLASVFMVLVNAVYTKTQKVSFLGVNFSYLCRESVLDYTLDNFHKALTNKIYDIIPSEKVNM